MGIAAGTFRAEPLARILLAVAALLGALMVLKAAGFVVTSSQVTGAAVRPGGGGGDANDLKESLTQAKTSAEQLKKKNLFVTPAPKQNPVGEVVGILGDEALINDKWYKVGDSVGDAKIVAIEPTKVKVVWDGQEKEFSPMVIAGERGGAMRGRFNSLSPEERQKMRQQWQSMSPEERQRRREEMRQRFGGRGG
jgi:hypothetical protein